MSKSRMDINPAKSIDDHKQWCIDTYGENKAKEILEDSYQCEKDNIRRAKKLVQKLICEPVACLTQEGRAKLASELKSIYTGLEIDFSQWEGKYK